MVRLSNIVLGILNLITIFLSIAIIGVGIWLSNKLTKCEQILDWPVIAIGVFFLLVSIAGFVGSCFRVSCLLWFYLVVMFLFILLCVCSTIFLFVVTKKGGGETVSGLGYKEYRLGDYSHWLQNRVDNVKNWNRFKSCLQDTKICQSLDNASPAKLQDFYKIHLSSLESGCCKPPNDCNFNYISATNWTRMPTSSSTNPDCTAWSNDPNILCYNCQSCMAGMVDNTKSHWKREAIASSIFGVVLIIVYTVACCALRNNHKDNSRNQNP